MKLKFVIPLIMMFFFSFFGMVIGGNLLHELSHKYDFRKIAYDDTICLLEFGGDEIASYRFYVDDYTEFDRIEKHTELRAYSISGVYYLIYLICFVMVCFYVIRLEKEDLVLPELDVDLPNEG